MNRPVTCNPAKIYFTIIGIDDKDNPELSERVRTAIAIHHVFSGGKRHHEIMRKYLPADHVWIDITVPLDNVFRQYENHSYIVVFASGDPLFFGFANTVRKRLPDAAITLIPTFNSLQTLAHRLLLPYHDMHVVSLTGRPWHEFDRSLIEGHAKIGILTDREHTPATIAERMQRYGYNNYIMHTGEGLGSSTETVHTLSLEEAQTISFRHPNCLIIERTHERPRPFGIPESEFELLDGRVNMITKAPIRLLSLAQLDLRHRHTLWDIGFCTGSVSIEAKLQFPHLQIVAFEQRPEGERLMEINSIRFGTPGIITRIGNFLQAELATLPAPDAVFIGGHGGHMDEIVRRASEHLLPGGVIVFNSVSDQSRELFAEAVGHHGLSLTGTQHVAIDDHNPILIMKAQKI